jgi:hypothetical protein
MAPGNKGIMEGKDNPAIVFSGATKDWPAFKDAIQLGADKLDTTWLFEGGRTLAEFFARQLKEKTGTAKMRATAVAREVLVQRTKATTYQPRSMRTPMPLSRGGSRTRISRQAYCCRSTRTA